jgi:DNA-binding response OmpR family regulator
MASVLIIEDDPDMRELERTVLECSGYDVCVALNGQDGLRKLQEGAPCVIVLDLMMPVMDGLTFLAERRRNAEAAKVPVLCVSAAGNEMTEQALKLGARECIHKPADLDELCERVSYYCHSTPQPGLSSTS